MAKKSNAGRPTDYKEEYCELAKNYCLLGATDIELSNFLGVCEKTLNVWKNKHPEFLQSIKAGKEEADALVASKLFHKACGFSHKDIKFATHEGVITDSKEYDKHYPPDSTAAIFWLKNRQKKNWRDKNEVEVNVSSVKDIIAGARNKNAE